MPPGRSAVVGLLLVLLAAFAWFQSTLGLGFRSDDFLLGYYADGEGGAFDRAVAEFGRGWFGVRDLWRPLVSLSLAANFAFGAEPWAFRVVNVALCGVAAFATACVAARLAPARPRLAFAVAAALVLLHPAAVEPAAWISARTTGLEVAFGTLATLAFVRHRDGVGSAWLPAGLFACALASKEGAVALPGLWLALEVGRANGAAVGARLRFLWPAALVLIAYFVLRLCVLGLLTTAEAGHGAWSRFVVLAVRSATWLAPPTPDGTCAWVALAAFTGLCLSAPREVRRLVAMVACAGLLLLLPTTHSLEPIGTMTGRLVFPAVPALALASALCAAALGSTRRLVVVLAVLVVSCGAYALGSAEWMRRYAEEDREVTAVRTELLREVGDSGPGRPMAVSMLPGLPLLQTHLWSMLGVPPFAPRDHALVGLAEMLQRDVDAPGLYGDAAMAHAMAELGAGTLAWDPAKSRFTALPRPPRERTRLEASGDPGAFATRELLPATAYATIEVEPAVPCRRVALALLDDLPGEWAFGVVEQEVPASGRVVFDLTHSVAVLLRAGNGAAFRGVHVRLDGVPAPPPTIVVARATVDSSPLPSPLAGRTVSPDELVASLVPPRGDVPLRLYLGAVGRTTSCDVVAGGALAFPVVERQRLVLAAGLFGGGSAHWFWQTPPGYAGTPWRSPIDWCRLR